MARLAEIKPDANTQSLFLGSRGYSRFDELVPVCHLDVSTDANSRLQCNVFEPKSQLIKIFGAAGTGKSMLAGAFISRHVNAGGAVCLVTNADAYTQREDSPERLLAELFAQHEEKFVQCSMDDDLPEFASITKLDYPQQSLRSPLHVVLREIRSRLKPFSLVVIDEFDLLVTRQSNFDFTSVAEEITSIIRCGSTVVLLSTMFDSATYPYFDLDLSRRAKLIFGRMSPYAFPSTEGLQEPLLSVNSTLGVNRMEKSARYLYMDLAKEDAQVITLPFDQVIV